MRVYLESLGCRLNEAELAAWGRALGARGGSVVPLPELADVMVLNSCAVTAEAARKSRKHASRLHRGNPEAKLVLTGCLVSLDTRRAAGLAGVDLVVPNSDKERLVELLESWRQPADVPPDVPPDVRVGACCSSPRTTTFGSRRTRAFVKVQDGCRNRCSFCIVTLLRGDEQSRPVDEILAEIASLQRAGFAEVVLTGVHLGGYGLDKGSSLTELVGQILRRTRVSRLRLSSLEPWEIEPSFWELWRDARLCPHLHLPLQSGADSVLRRMARRGDVESYLALVDRARAAIPGLVLTTDIIVGFPGETDQEFEQSLALCRRVGFAHIHVFPYSAREGTAAARMRPQVEAPVKRERCAKMLELALELRRDVLTRYVGSERWVLWEGAGEPLDDGRVRWSGLTDNYLRVESEVAATMKLEGKVSLTHLTAVRAPGCLVGTVGDPAAARSECSRTISNGER